MIALCKTRKTLSRFILKVLRISRPTPYCLLVWGNTTSTENIIQKLLNFVARCIDGPGIFSSQFSDYGTIAVESSSHGTNNNTRSESTLQSLFAGCIYTRWHVLSMAPPMPGWSFKQEGRWDMSCLAQDCTILLHEGLLPISSHNRITAKKKGELLAEASSNQIFLSREVHVFLEATHRFSSFHGIMGPSDVHGI